MNSTTPVKILTGMRDENRKRPAGHEEIESWAKPKCINLAELRLTSKGTQKMHTIPR